MALKDAYEVVKENATNLVKNPKDQIKRALGVGADTATSGGMTGAAKEALANRKNRLEEEERKATGYKRGGAVKAKAPAPKSGFKW